VEKYLEPVGPQMIIWC